MFDVVDTCRYNLVHKILVDSFFALLHELLHEFVDSFSMNLMFVHLESTKFMPILMSYHRIGVLTTMILAVQLDHGMEAF